jgi:phenylacetate-CoA ligase
MTQMQMGEYIAYLNSHRPLLIIAYVESIYELARYAMREELKVIPQSAIISTAGTLYPFMRNTIEQVFQCKVYNRYGSREVGNVACEGPGWEGLWIAPWGNYLEIVDSSGCRLPDGVEGDILITSLTNFAMPLIRYRIGDRGIITPTNGSLNNCQVLAAVVGRTSDTIRTTGGNVVHGGYLIGLLYFKDWVLECQLVQKDLSHIIYRIVSNKSDIEKSELDEIAANAKLVMGNNCQITFDFVDHIPTPNSGKYRYVLSEINED